MKKFISFILLLNAIKGTSQPNVLPAVPQSGAIALTHATIHVGNGDVIDDATIVFSNGKITSVGRNVATGDA